MILCRIEPFNFGPFRGLHDLDIDSDVTVLTGPNDCGKTSILRLIRLMCLLGQEEMKEEDVNLERLHESGGPWQNDRLIKCTATFKLSNNYKDYVPNLLPGDRVVVSTGLAPGAKFRVVERVIRNNATLGHNPGISRMPRVVTFPPESEVGNIIDLEKPTKAEHHLLQIAFGSSYTPGVLAGLSAATYTGQIEKAKDRLNTRLKSILPASTKLRFNVAPILNDKSKLGVYLIDEYGAHTSLGMRGSGIRRVMSLLGLLLEVDRQEQTIILLDEPETSLHADSQHMLRTLLEQLGSLPTIQVIFATHSPSMINVMRPHCIRVLERTSREGVPVTVFLNAAFKDNYSVVRSSLGLSPADSLLYSPVSIITEGDTEVKGIPLVLKKLADASVPGFERVEDILAQVFVLNGAGDNFVRLCRLVKAQGIRPVIFVDGDKIRRVNQHRVKDEHAEVPIVHLDERVEFEQVVDEAVYFEALSASLSDSDLSIDSSAFHSWASSQSLPKQMMFSKQIELWLYTVGAPFIPPKEVVMQKAIELADVSQIAIEPFLELVNELTALLTKHSY